MQQIAAPREIYDDPANLFVAGFIGSPPMNMVSGAIADGAFTNAGRQRSGHRPAAARPMPCSASARRTRAIVAPEAGHLKGTVFACELTGNETIVTCRLGRRPGGGEDGQELRHPARCSRSASGSMPQSSACSTRRAANGCVPEREQSDENAAASHRRRLARPFPARVRRRAARQSLRAGSARRTRRRRSPRLGMPASASSTPLLFTASACPKSGSGAASPSARAMNSCCPPRSGVSSKTARPRTCRRRTSSTRRAARSVGLFLRRRHALARESLARLGLERVDILLVHDIDVSTHGSQEAADARIRELFDKGGYRALDELGSAGAVTAIGAGVNEWPICERLLEPRAISTASCWPAATRFWSRSRSTLLPLCEERGVGIILGGPFNSGILATGPVAGARYDYAPAPVGYCWRRSRASRRSAVRTACGLSRRRFNSCSLTRRSPRSFPARSAPTR